MDEQSSPALQEWVVAPNTMALIGSVWCLQDLWLRSDFTVCENAGPCLPRGQVEADVPWYAGHGGAASGGSGRGSPAATHPAHQGGGGRDCPARVWVNQPALLLVDGAQQATWDQKNAEEPWLLKR